MKLFAETLGVRSVTVSSNSGRIGVSDGTEGGVPLYSQYDMRWRPFLIALGIMALAGGRYTIVNPAVAGGVSEYFAMHVKGMEMGGYDPRASKGMATNYACGPRGGCHHAGGRTVGEEVQKNNRFEEKGKGIVTKMQREPTCTL